MRFENTTLGQLSLGGKGNYGIAASAVPYSENLLTYLRITDISDQGTLRKQSLMSVADENADKYLLKPNDIVFARTGNSTGRNYFYDGTDGNFVYAGFLIKFSLDPQKVNPRYIKYYCQSSQYWNWVQSFNTGSTRGNINAQTFANMEIPLPPREQQDFLVRLLRPLDDKIELNQKINENLEQQAATLINQYQSVTDSAEMLSNIMGFENGFAFQSSTYLSSGQYKVITIKNVQDGRIDSDGAACIDSLPSRMKNGCILQIGDALLSLTGNVGRVGIVCESNLLLNQRVAKIVPHNKALLPFLYFVYRQPSVKTQLESIAKGTAQLNLSPVETLKLTVPYEKASALSLTQTLAPLYQTIISNGQENIALALLRDTLLPKLMSSEIDVSDIALSC